MYRIASTRRDPVAAGPALSRPDPRKAARAVKTPPLHSTA